MTALSREQMLVYWRMLDEKNQRQRPCLMQRMYQTPEVRAGYGKHMGFFEAGAAFRQRLAMCGNRVGKTEGMGGYELALHLTGRYPDWWSGRRFDRAIEAWAAGDTLATTRDILQTKLVGKKGKLQECKALVHPSFIVDVTAGLVPDSFSTVKIRHACGDISVLTFKSYDQGRATFQGTEIDVILLDEEPPLDVYSECMLRTMDTGKHGENGEGRGLVMLTFTPLKGMSETVMSFFPDAEFHDGVVGEGLDKKHVTLAGWDDAPHLSEEEKAVMLAAMPPFQRVARSRGLPQMGAGVIYPVEQERYVVQPFELPDGWNRAYGMDVGWNCTAALWGAWDEDGGLTVYAEHYAQQATPLENSHGIKGRGAWIPGVIDPASAGANQKDGTNLLEEYRGLGLDVSPADNSVETGIMRVWTMLSTGKLKVFANCVNLLRELRGYIRDEKGRVVKQNDHACDALRYLCMSGPDVAKVKQAAQARRYAQNKQSWVA